MKLSEISPQPPCRSKRSHYKGAERGGFTFDMGTIAQGGKKKVKKSESSDYHRKRG